MKCNTKKMNKGGLVKKTGKMKTGIASCSGGKKKTNGKS